VLADPADDRARPEGRPRPRGAAVRRIRGERARDLDRQKRARPPACRCFSPHNLRHRRISLLHLRGVPWARIGEQVGQRNHAVAANTYSHVLTDKAELNYAELLGAENVAGNTRGVPPTGPPTATGNPPICRL
jgi:integrase